MMYRFWMAVRDPYGVEIGVWLWLKSGCSGAVVSSRWFSVKGPRVPAAFLSFRKVASFCFRLLSPLSLARAT